MTMYWGSWVDYKLLGWVGSTPYAVGELIAPGNGHTYGVSAKTGSSGTVQPAFPTNGGTVGDAGLTWQDRGVEKTYNGVYIWSGFEPYVGSPQERFALNVGKKPSVARFGYQWLSNGAWRPFSATQTPLDAAWNQGMITLLDWDNWDLSNAGNNHLINYAAILAGTQTFGGVSIDSFLNTFAAAVAAYGKPFFIRMWHEMNADGGWSDNNFPWALGNVTAGGFGWTNSEAQHVSAWRKIIGIFQAQGANNVTWVWCPNILATSGKTSIHTLANFYPGSAYVDWLGLDGYDQFSNLTFQQVFGGGPGIQNSWSLIHALDTSKPICIPETNSNPGHNFSYRATWYDGALRAYAPDTTLFPNLGMLCWFMWSNGGPEDLAVDQDGSATGDLDMAPFKAGVALPTYIAGGGFTMPALGAKILAPTSAPPSSTMVMMYS